MILQCIVSQEESHAFLPNKQTKKTLKHLFVPFSVGIDVGSYYKNQQRVPNKQLFCFRDEIDASSNRLKKVQTSIKCNKKLLNKQIILN